MNKLEKEFIPYEQALALKELGFNKPCFGLYHNDKTFYPTQCKSHDQFHGQVCLAPLYQQAFKFFREKYNLYHKIDPNNIKDISYTIFDEDDEIYEDSCYWSYELAEEACLNKLLEICKNEQ
jgi:hypothetical protein